MDDLRMRLLLTLILLLCISGVVLLYSNTNSKPDLKGVLDDISLTFDEWRGENLILSPDIFNILQTQSILVREYRNDKGDKVTLAVIYYPDNQISFHAPEACLGGVGYTIMTEEIKTLKFSGHVSLQVKKLHYNRNQTHELIYYFYQTNNFISPNYLTFRWQMLLNQLKHKRTNGALIRVSTQVNLTPHLKKLCMIF